MPFEVPIEFSYTPMKCSPTSRYGIAEWYGNDITSISPPLRKDLGKLASTQVQTGDLSGGPICPFLSSLKPNSRCNKLGGVCSLRRFHKGENKEGIPVPGDNIVTICPSRFLQGIGGRKSLFLWISEVMLESNQAIVIKETPFLRSALIKKSLKEGSGNDSVGPKAGRIDWIVSSLPDEGLKWCAVETQALYFSGDKMKLEFDAYIENPFPVLFPVGRRRPDYRSSGPKRLAPQLDVKVPVLRNWGNKVAVIIDRYFHDNMGELLDAYPRAKNDKERLDNSDIVWFVVDYDNQLKLRIVRVIYTTLESSRQALNATEPISKSDFNRDLKKIINSEAKSGKVFRLS